MGPTSEGSWLICAEHRKDIINLPGNKWLNKMCMIKAFHRP
jgi:hypothetical protein